MKEDTALILIGFLVIACASLFMNDVSLSGNLALVAGY